MQRASGGLLNNPTFQFPPAPHLVAPDQDLDWQGGDFRRHNKMIARSATRKGYRKIIHSLICQSLFKHAMVSMMKLAVYMYTKIEIREIDGSYLCLQ